MSTYTIIALLAQPWANALAFALAVTRWRGMAQSETHINSPNGERWLWLVPHMHLGFSLLLKSLAPSVHSAYAWPAPLVVSLWNNWLSFWSLNRILILEFTSFHLPRHPLRPLSIARLSSISFEKLRINVELCCKMPASHHCDIPRTINAVDHQRPLGFTSKIASSQWNRYWTLEEQWSTDVDRSMHSTEKSIRNSLLNSNCVRYWFTVSRTMYIRMRFNAIVFGQNFDSFGSLVIFASVSLTILTQITAVRALKDEWTTRMPNVQLRCASMWTNHRPVIILRSKRANVLQLSNVHRMQLI